MLAKLFKTQSPARIIAFGFAALILLGSVLLIMPFSVKEGVNLKYEDALYTSTSAVCITGLITVDTGTTYSAIGQAIICVLMQMGGLGVTAVGAGIILALRKKMDVKGRSLIKEAMNVSSGKSIIKFIKDVFITTAIIEIAGAVLSFFVFIKDFGFFEAVGKSLFHSVAAFNNAGFDNLGDNFNSIAKYSGNAYFNIITALLIIFGGIGFLVIKELLQNRFNFKKLSMHAKVVLTVTAVLLVVGTLLIKLTENISWLGAFFSSVTARTAGFSTFSFGEFTIPGLMVVIVLMFIGASPGSTGGGVKTATMFVLFKGISASATNKSEKAFRYSIPKTAFKKLRLSFCSVYRLCFFRPISF